MIIVTSASYIDQEFSSEFGLIPPAFLPVGNKRLYSYLARCLPTNERRVLTVPESFAVSGFDQKRLDNLGFTVLHIPENLSLGESVVCAINLSGSQPDAPLRILHGDTLIQDLPANALDVVTLSEVDGAYNWAAWHDTGEQRLTQLDENRMVGRVKIANGYFAFSDCGLFVRSVIHASGSFVEGVNGYSRERPLRGLDVEQWFDFGHEHTYYRSKARMTTQRASNKLQINPKTVKKSSEDSQKMASEYHWFSSLPGNLKIFTPHLINRLDGQKTGYEIQYLYLASLNELYVFGQLPRFIWHKIFQSCFAFLEACRQHGPQQTLELESSALFENKTRRRLDQWCESTGVDLQAPWTINGRDVPGIDDIVARTAAMIPSLGENELCVVHGDFCFSNMLYDFRSQSIKVIDPRGCLPDGTPSIFGDQRYDIGKLAHSVCGLYDFIVAGDYRVEITDHKAVLELPDSPAISDVQDIFLDLVEEHCGIDRKLLWAMQVQLFLSMIPLHSDDTGRQQAFLANALRLCSELD